jgi:hypothetical protein
MSGDPSPSADDAELTDRARRRRARRDPRPFPRDQGTTSSPPPEYGTPLAVVP